LKRPRLLASYSTKPTTPTPRSSMQQLQKYLAMGTTSIDDDCMRFWTQNSSTLDKLVAPALRALSVPASSAAVKRVFSQGGIILRPHRARMSDRLLSQLIFLKCNRPRDWFDCVTDWWLYDCIYFADSVVCNCIFINSWCSGSDVHSKVLARRLILVLVLVLGPQVLVLVLAPQVLVLVLVLVRPGTCYNTGRPT